MAATIATTLTCLALSASTAAAVTLPPGWTHISVNVVIRHRAYTLTYDRGRVTAVTSSSLTLRESDGSVWTIQVSPTATITINGQAASLSQVQPLEAAETLSVNGAPASKVIVRETPAVAAAIARQQALAAARAARQAALAARRSQTTSQVTTQTTASTTTQTTTQSPTTTSGGT